MEKRSTLRTFLKMTGVIWIVLATWFMFASNPSAILAQTKEETVLLTASQLSGPFAESGRDQNRGVILAVEDFGGQVLGNKIRVIEMDVPNPSEAVRKIKGIVEQEKVKFIQVGTSSGVALAVMEYVKTQNVIMGALAGADSITGTACNKNTFRWQVPTYGAIREVVPKIIDKYNANTFFTITPEYVFGHDLLRNTEEILKEKGKKLLGNLFHPLGETEYSQYISKALAAKPDCLLFLNFGDDTVNALKQAVSFGAKQQTKIAVVWGAGVTQLKAIGTKVLEDVIVGTQYEFNIDNPVNKRFVGLYTKKHNELPSLNAAAAYQQTLAMLMAIKKAGTTDTAKVINAWENIEYDGVTGKEAYRGCDHQCIKNYFTLSCKKQNEKKFEDDYSDIIGYSKNFLECAKTGCKK